MRTQWDVVVVGASFAGAACALAAREYGLRTCVLERKRDPGIKLHTTGIIVREAAEGTWLSRLPPQLVHRVEGVHLHAPNLRCMRLSRPDYYFLTTDTPGVMRWLAGELRDAGVSIIMAEQNLDFVLNLSDRCYVLEKGVVVYHGTAAELRDNEDVQNRYLHI